MILILDNYDSFVHTVARYLRELGAEVEVVRSDVRTVEEVRERSPEGIVLSPGPRTPAEAGLSVPVVRAMAATTPILGICLGHQVVGEAFGAGIVRAPSPVHGRSSPIHHRGEGILAGLPSPFAAARYHSLVVSPERLPPGLEVTAWTEEGDVMALRHRTLPVWGVQFHPESILTEGGHLLLANFLRLCGRAPAPVPA
jgi:anthranilate synthase/aminodeoxychorismate synthase-like glutamine amidotransferase